MTLSTRILRPPTWLVLLFKAAYLLALRHNTLP